MADSPRVRASRRETDENSRGGAASWLLALLEAGEKRDGAGFPGLKQPGTAGAVQLFTS